MSWKALRSTSLGERIGQHCLFVLLLLITRLRLPTHAEFNYSGGPAAAGKATKVFEREYTLLDSGEVLLYYIVLCSIILCYISCSFIVIIIVVLARTCNISRSSCPDATLASRAASVTFDQGPPAASLEYKEFGIQKLELRPRFVQGLSLLGSFIYICVYIYIHIHTHLEHIRTYMCVYIYIYVTYV